MGESIDFVRQLEEQMQVYGVKTSRFAVDEESLRRNGGGLEEYFFQDYDYDRALPISKSIVKKELSMSFGIVLVCGIIRFCCRAVRMRTRK